jgi:Zn-dependent protease with chaperone function
MAHVIRGHAMDRVITDSAMAVGARSVPVHGVLAKWLGTAGIKVLQSAYSQDLELEADALAVRLVAAAGYDVRGAKRLLSRLSELGRHGGEAELGHYFSSHPAIHARIRKLDRLVRGLSK